MAMLLDAVNAVWRGDVKSDDDERIQRIVPVLKSVKLDPTLEGSYRDVTVTSRVSALTDVIAKQRLMRVRSRDGLDVAWRFWAARAVGGVASACAAPDPRWSSGCAD